MGLIIRIAGRRFSLFNSYTSVYYCFRMELLCIQDENTALTPVERKICVYYSEFHGGKFGKLWVFGPNYRRFGTEFSECVKEEAMERIRSNSQVSFQGVMNAIGNIELEVRAAYADNALNDLTVLEFQYLMIKDGCFFLLLAFSILGADPQKLKYAENHPVFGVGCATEYMDNIIESMFFVGNQIPLMVLEQLMHLDIFQRMKATIGSKQQRLGLAKRTLYKFLMVELVPKPVDLLHCLQSIMLGPKRSSNAAVRKNVDDTEDCVSASKLSEQGVRFRKLGGEFGIRGMHYECNKFSAVLYLPDLGVDRYTDLLIKCLLKYETVQERQGVEPEASSYFKFMSDLIHHHYRRHLDHIYRLDHHLHPIRPTTITTYRAKSIAVTAASASSPITTTINIYRAISIAVIERDKEHRSRLLLDPLK